MTLIFRNPATWPQLCGYGCLYNFYAIDNAKKITSHDDWRVPTDIDGSSFVDFVNNGTEYTGALEIKSSKEHPDHPGFKRGYGGNNDYGLSFSAYGFRNATGVFFKPNYIEYGSGETYYFWMSSFSLDLNQIFFFRYYSPDYIDSGSVSPMLNFGIPARVMRDATESEQLNALNYEVLGQYTGNDNQKYDYVKIPTSPTHQMWIISNLKESKYRNGDEIPIIKNYSDWSADTNGARCFPMNDIGWV